MSDGIWQGVDTERPNLNEIPTVTVIGKLKNGTCLIRSEWSGATTQLSERALANVATLGLNVVNDPEKYLF